MKYDFTKGLIEDNGIYKNFKMDYYILLIALLLLKNILIHNPAVYPRPLYTNISKAVLFKIKSNYSEVENLAVYSGFIINFRIKISLSIYIYFYFGKLKFFYKIFVNFINTNIIIKKIIFGST